MRPEWIGEIKAVLFDWGGTLCTTAGEVDVWGRAGRGAIQAANSAGISVGNDRLGSLKSFFEQARVRAEADPELRELDSVCVLSEWLGGEGHPDASPDALHLIVDAFWSCWVGCLEPVGPVGDSLATLKRAGHRLGLVSNTSTPAKWCRVELERLGIARHFDGLTFSSELGRRKPHPIVYEDALRKLDLDGRFEPRRVLFVGDSPACDVAGPQQMGMRAALVCDRKQALPADAASGLAPDLLLNRATDVASLLIQQD